MTNNYWVRKAHRYMGLFVGIQLLFWVVSGLYFTWNDIDKVRGEHLKSEIENDINVQQGQLADINQVLESFRSQTPQLEKIKGVGLRLLLGQPVYEIHYSIGDDSLYQLVDAQSGELMPMLDEEVAMAIAKADFTEDVEVLSVELLETESAHAEYRGRDLPLYRVSMDHSSDVNIYVSAQRGLVTARRNTTWRVFDFLWMTHTMDYQTRDDFNHMLVKIFSILGLITVLSGFLLWAMTSRVFNK
jgi:PepSY-associated TM region